MKITIRAAGNLRKNLADLRRRLAPKVQYALKVASNELLQVAQAHVPVDTQALHDSGRVTRQGSGLNSVFTVGFAGKDFDASGYSKDRERRPPMNYVLFVHQMQVAFLADAIVMARQEMKELIREEMS